MALLYLSIFGLVIAIADTILLFVKFTQKEKLVWFHVCFYTTFLICGCVALTNKDYKTYMNNLNGRTLTDPLCIAAAFPLECQLAA
jgi:putative effector of murein hydrolase